MEISWEGSEYEVCPQCKQVVSKDSIKFRTHICLGHSDFVKLLPFPDF